MELQAQPRRQFLPRRGRQRHGVAPQTQQRVSFLLLSKSSMTRKTQCLERSFRFGEQERFLRVFSIPVQCDFLHSLGNCFQVGTQHIPLIFRA